jgi:anti-sigma regulatory factor (Ser/Thr protein kinase)
MRRHRTFSNQTGSVTSARRFVAEVLGGEVPEETEAAVTLMVSELATNSLTHAESAFQVEIDMTASGISVRVTDTGPGSPLLQSTDPRQPRGRGLRVVDGMSDEWGIVSATNGKTVWFRVDRDLDAGADLAG